MSHKRPERSSCAILVGMLLVLNVSACARPPDAPVVWVTIPPGDSLSAIAESLTVNGILKSPRSFEILARIGKKHLEIKPGVYPLRPGAPVGEILVELMRGRPDATKTRVDEGIWLSELLPSLSKTLNIQEAEFWDAARDAELRSRVGTEVETVEGYLFPTVYYVTVGSSALEVITQMVDTFEAHWDPDWNARLDTLGMTRSEIVSLASIIEGEAPLEEDRSLVSSVYHNRLSRGQRLQADPTVVYALGRRRRLYNVDYGVNSEYNTYIVSGIPQGPICQPSTASIEAALYPATTDYFYFVAVGNGRHIFSKTYRQHLAKIRRTRSGRSSASLER